MEHTLRHSHPFPLSANNTMHIWISVHISSFGFSVFAAIPSLSSHSASYNFLSFSFSISFCIDPLSLRISDPLSSFCPSFFAFEPFGGDPVNDQWIVLSFDRCYKEMHFRLEPILENHSLDLHLCQSTWHSL